MDTALSVVIPAYNAETFIEHTLQSLLKQNTDRMEIIVVDDGSSDGTGETVRRLIDVGGYPNLRLHAQQNGGVSSARNTGLQQAKGAYVFFLDADDYVADGFVPSLLKLMDETGADVLHWPYDLVDTAGNTLQAFPYPDAGASPRAGVQVLEDILLKKATRICTGSAAINRKLLTDNRLEYTLGCIAGEDQEFTYSALTFAQSVVFSSGLKAYYVRHPSSVMSSYSIKKFSAVRALERVRDRFFAMGTPAFDALARHVDNFDIPHSYAGTYTMCLRHLMGAQGLPYKTARARLSREIEAQFPGMEDSILKKLSSRKKKGLPDRLDIFRLSPLLYLRFSNLRQPK